jgi:DNA polymerase-3 subunit delta'
LQLRPLAPDLLERLIRRQAPELDGASLVATARLAEGSIGRALALNAEGALELYKSVFQLVARAPALDLKALHQLADRAGRQGDQGKAVFETVSELYFGLLRRVLMLAGGTGSDAEIVPGETQILARLAARRGLDRWLELWDNSRRLVARTDSINLDRKQVVLNVFLALEDERT